jgi:hypothetical protein
MENIMDEKVTFFRSNLKKFVENTHFDVVNNTVKSREDFAKRIKRKFKSINVNVKIEDRSIGSYNTEYTKALYLITNKETGKTGILKYDNHEKQFKYIE